MKMQKEPYEDSDVHLMDDKFKNILTGNTPNIRKKSHKNDVFTEEIRLAEEAKSWYSSKMCADTVKAIRKNNMEAIFVKNKKMASHAVLKRIPLNAKVSHGGSLTIKELGLIEKLKEGNYIYDQTQSKEKETRRKAFYSDIYLTSVNAITKNGSLIAIDGVGNRTAAMMYGPDKVIIVAGKNKIVDSIEEGFKRIKNYVAPLHAKRRNKNLPCAVAAKCVNCVSKHRMCNKLMIIDYEREKDRITVILVGEELGI